MKKILLSPWTAILTLFICLFVRIQDPSFVESVRLRYFDQLINSKKITISDQIHVVNIDDAAIEKRGQFPFPRDQYAQIIDDLYQRNAGLVVFNVFMPDADRFSKDVIFAEQQKKTPVILPQVATQEDIKFSYEPFRPGVSIIGEGLPGLQYKNIQPNVRIINENASGVGVVNTIPEIDGVVRRIPIVINSQGKLYPSISLETLRVAAGDPSFQVKVNSGIIEAVRIPKFGKITTDNYGRIWVDWSTKPIEHSLDGLPKDFNGGIVIIGLTARGLNNPVATSRGEVFPHYLQSSVLSTIASGTNIQRPDWADGLEILTLLVSGILLIFLTRWLYVGIATMFVLFVAGVIGSYYAYYVHFFLFDATAFGLGILFISLHSYTVKFLSDFFQKQQIKKQFGTYLSPAIVEKLQKNPELLKLGGESRELSIMFTDVRGFTSISEHYGDDVQGLTQIMNRYMTAMTAAILRNNGTLDKYIGDAQMAFWNAPLDESSHAKQAVKTAIEMLSSLESFNEEISKEGVPAFGMGLGINTGTVVVGNMGSDQRFDYTCLGDSVNLASRLEGQSKPYGVQIILGPLTAEQVRDEYDVIELDCIAVKGKKVGVKIYTLGQAATQDQFLDAYYNGRWIEAIEIAEDAIKNESPLKKYYNAMVERMRDGKPDDWDGTFRATTK